MNNFPFPRGDMFISGVELWAWLERANMVRGMVGADTSRKNLFGDAYPAMSVQGSTALIPITGPLIKGCSAFEKMFGAMGHEQIAEDLDTADANPAIKNIVLMVNSPGGTVAGTPEAAGKVATIAKRKNVVAFTDSLMGSAAYYISSGARAIYATPSSTVGSIGTMLELVNITDALKQRGISVEIFASDKFKGSGHPARTLSDDQRKYFQDRVNEQAIEFKTFVQDHRRGVPDSAMLGQTFFGNGAAKVGLVDHIVSSVGDMLQELSNPGSTGPRSFGSLVDEYQRRGMSRAQAVTSVVHDHPEAHRRAFETGEISTF